MFSCRMPGSDDRRRNDPCASLRCGCAICDLFGNLLPASVRSLLTWTGSSAFFSRRGGFCWIITHRPCLTMPCMHACMYSIYSRNALEAPRFRRPGYYFGITILELIRFIYIIVLRSNCHYIIIVYTLSGAWLSKGIPRLAAAWCGSGWLSNTMYRTVIQ